MKHVLMHPAFPDIVGQWAAPAIDGNVRVRRVARGASGRIEERLDPGILTTFKSLSPEDIIDALVIAAAEQDIADTRDW